MMETILNGRNGSACFCLLVVVGSGCIPPTDRFGQNTTSAPASAQASNTTQFTDLAQLPPKPKRKVPNDDARDLPTRMREVQLRIEEKNSELRQLEKTLAELKHLQQIQQKISARPQTNRPPSGHAAPPIAAAAKKEFVPRVFPSVPPEPLLPAEQLIESKLDDIDRVLAKLRAAGLKKEAAELNRSVLEARSRLRDRQANFEPLGKRELHVVGLYEGVEFELGRQRAEVHVTYTGAPVVLCLTSYEKIHWTVKVADGAKLESIILGGRIQFLIDPPEGVEVIDCTAENAGTRPVGFARARHSTDSSGSRFPALAKQLEDITGLEVVSFQGDYRFANKPIIVGPESDSWRQERVLAELRRVHLAATLPERVRTWHSMKELNFTAVHYRFAAGSRQRHEHHGAVTGSIGPFTPLGPNLDQHKPFPANVSCPVYDSKAGQYYAIAGHSLVQVNQRGGKHLELNPPKDFPDVSWPCGLAFDSKRRKVVMVSLGGTGYMYGYEPATEKWTLMADMKEAGLVPFVYLPEQDEFIGLQVHHGSANSLYRYDHDGNFLGQQRMSQGLLRHGAKHSHCQAIPVGDVVVFLIGAEHTTPEGDRAVRAFVVDPGTGDVVFSTLHDDETLRALAAAEIANPADWTKQLRRAPDAEAKAPGDEGASVRRSPEAVLAELRRQGSKGIEEAPELHLLGFYEPGRRFQRTPGEKASIAVRIKSSDKPIVAALTAYESTHWKVTLEPGANVAAVILSGYHSHSAEGLPQGVPLIKMTYEDGSRNYFYGYDKNDRDYDKLLVKARKVTGLEVLTFQGSYTPLANTTYRIRQAVPGDYKAVRGRIDEAQRMQGLLEQGRQRAAKDIAAGKFPPGTVEFEGHHYALLESRKSWADARKDCQARGGDLVCITSKAEQQLVQTLAAGTEIWLGGMRDETSKRFTWSDDTTFEFTNWGDGEPSDSRGGENRIEMWPNGQWNDQPAHDRQAFVCEWSSLRLD